MRNHKPSAGLITYMKDLGFEYKVATDSIFADKRDAPTHYFQSSGANGVDLCSTILMQDADKFYLNTKIDESFGTHCPHCKHILNPVYKKRSKTSDNALGLSGEHFALRELTPAAPSPNTEQEQKK